MSAPGTPRLEPLHLLLLRAVVYLGVILTALTPVTRWAFSVDALLAPAACVLAALLGLGLGRRLAVSALRTPVVVVAGLVVVLLGVLSNAVLGGSEFVTRTIGIRAVLLAGDAVTFSLIVFGAVIAVRVLSLRYPALVLLEVAAAAASVVLLFAAHRDEHITRPRFLSDWAFMNGRDPMTLLLGIGLATLFGVLLLLMVRQRLRRTAAALLVLLLLFASVLLLGGSGDVVRGGAGGGQSSSGSSPLDNDLSYGDRDKRPDPKPLALVIFHDEYRSPVKTIYLRQRVFSQLVANRLAPSALSAVNEDVPLDLPGRRIKVPVPAMPKRHTAPVRTSVCMIQADPVLLALANPAELEPKANPDPKKFKRVYGVVSRCLVDEVVNGKTQKVYATLEPLPAGNPAWSDQVRQQYLDYPRDPRYAKLAKKIIADAIRKGTVTPQRARSPLVQAQLFLAWIHDNTTYSLRPGNGNSVDPAAEFLFGNRKGFCQHVATAMTYLMRSRGLPARVATGCSIPEERRGNSSSVLVQTSDGHAWCEVYLHGAGWVILDGSPGKTEEPEFPEPSRALTNYFRESFAKKKPQLESEDSDGSGGSVKEWLLGLGKVLGVWLVVLVALLYLIKVWRRLAPWLAPAGQLYRVCYRASLDRLAEVGLIREFGETREEFSRRVSELVPEFEPLTASHVRQAVGGIAELDRRNWLALHAQTGQRLRALFSRLRRWLGLANPISWLMVH